MTKPDTSAISSWNEVIQRQLQQQIDEQDKEYLQLLTDLPKLKQEVDLMTPTHLLDYYDSIPRAPFDPRLIALYQSLRDYARHVILCHMTDWDHG